MIPLPKEIIRKRELEKMTKKQLDAIIKKETKKANRRIETGTRNGYLQQSNTYNRSFNTLLLQKGIGNGKGQFRKGLPRNKTQAINRIIQLDKFMNGDTTKKAVVQRNRENAKKMGMSTRQYNRYIKILRYCEDNDLFTKFDSHIVYNAIIERKDDGESYENIMRSFEKAMKVPEHEQIRIITKSFKYGMGEYL